MLLVVYISSQTVSNATTCLQRGNLTQGSWNPRGTNLAVDWHYNGGDMSISETSGQISLSVDGFFYQNEGQYRCIDTNTIGSQSVNYASSAGNASTIDSIASSRIVYGSNATKTTTSSYSYNSAFPSGFYTNNGQFALHCAYYGVGNVAGWTLYTADATDVPLNFIVQNGGGGGHSYELISSKGGQTINGSLTINSGIIGDHVVDNSAFKNTLIVEKGESSEASGESIGSAVSFGISFRRWWTGSTPTITGGIYAVGSGGWRSGMVIRTKTNQSSSGTHDVNALWLSPAGNGTFAGSVYSSSDRYIKKHIKSIDIKGLNVLFNISDKLLKQFIRKDTEKYSYGFIAQELEKYIPEAVSEGLNNDKTIKTVSYNIAYAKLFAALIYKIKELEKKVESSNH